MGWRKNLIKIIRPRLMANYEFVKKIEYDRDKIKRAQLRNLKNILMHSYKNVPYYTKVLVKANVIKNNKVNLENFDKIPFLTKEIIRENFSSLVSKDIKKRKWEYNASGGSTGKPIRLIQCQNFRDWRANKFYFKYLAGSEPGDREIKLWGSEYDIFKGTIGMRAKLENFILNRKFLNSFKVSKDQYFMFVREFNRFKPKHVWTYVDSIYEFARFIKKHNLKIYRPNAIITTAGMLSNDIRNFVQNVFKSKVLNQYGSREVSDIAAECRKQEGLHIFEHSHYVEIISNGKKAEDGEMGEVVITLLTNYAMPLIRYKIGDTAISKKEFCSCSRKFRLLKNVTGRTTDHFINSEGSVIHGEYFTHLFYFKDWIKKFKVVQEEINKINCYIVLNGKKNTTELKDMEEKIKLVMGKNCRVIFSFVKNIPASNSGKYLYTESKVKR